MAVLAPTQPSYLRMAELAVLETGTSMHCITSPRPWVCSDRRTFSCSKPPCHPRPSPRLSTPSRSMMCQGVCPSRLPLLIAFVKLVPVQVRNLSEVIQSAHMLLEYAPPMTLWLGPCGASDEAAQPIALARWQSLARPQSLRGAGPGRAARSCGTTTQERGHEARVPRACGRTTLLSVGMSGILDPSCRAIPWLSFYAPMYHHRRCMGVNPSETTSHKNTTPDPRKTHTLTFLFTLLGGPCVREDGFWVLADSGPVL